MQAARPLRLEPPVNQETAMQITIYGPGCVKCKKLYGNVQKAVEEAGVEAHIEKVEGVAEIARAGVMFTPGLAIDGALKTTGKVPDVARIVELIKQA
jgi:small redox-active disulfide protein 2